MKDDYLEPGSITWQQDVQLRRWLPKGTELGRLSRYEAAGLIKLLDPNAAWRREPASSFQRDFLTVRRRWKEGMTKGEASAVISEVKEAEKRGRIL